MIANITAMPSSFHSSRVVDKIDDKSYADSDSRAEEKSTGGEIVKGVGNMISG